MKARALLLSMMILALLLAGCATSAAPTAAPAIAPQPPSRQSSDPSGPLDNFGAATGGGAKSEAAQPPALDRLVIKNADLTIVVADPAGGMTSIMNLANSLDGYVVSSKSYKTQTQNGELPQANVVVRVPAAKLDDALASIHKLVKDPATDIQSENITGQDVTANYVDLQSKLTSLQNTQEQLLKIQDSATKTEDVLTVFNQISAINQQIEQTKGQIKYYEDSAAMSSVSVQLLALAGINPITIGGWQPVGVIRDAFQALIDVGKALLIAAIWLVVFFAPIGLVFYFPGRWLWRAIKRRQPRRYPQPVAVGGMPYYPPQQPAGPSEPPDQTQS